MPTSAPKFSQRIRPFSDEFNSDMRQMAEAVRRMEAAFDIVYKKALEPGRPQWPQPSAGAAAFPGHLITAAAADATGDTPSWVYTLQPITGISSGSWTSSGTTVRARNMAEDQTHYQHGQDLTLSTGTLTPSAVEGPVAAWDTGLTEAGVALWAFDAPNPMAVACSTDVGYGDPFDFLTMGAS